MTFDNWPTSLCCQHLHQCQITVCGIISCVSVGFLRCISTRHNSKVFFIHPLVQLFKWLLTFQAMLHRQNISMATKTFQFKVEISYPSSVKKIQRLVKFLYQEDNICRHDFTKQNYVENINTTKAIVWSMSHPLAGIKVSLLGRLLLRGTPTWIIFIIYIFTNSCGFCGCHHEHIPLLFVSSSVCWNDMFDASDISASMLPPHPKPMDTNKNAFLVACVLRYGTKSTFLVAKESFVVGFCLLVVCQRSQVFDSFSFQ